MSPDGCTTLTSPHLIGRLDPEQSKPGGEHGNDALDQGKTRRGQLWIILDNEA